jgi:pyruvate dehydrogenase E1 component alpha subunit/2-oxoisovalerate dehydrogenase E1 component alpha subunit
MLEPLKDATAPFPMGATPAGAIHHHMTRARVVSARMVALQRTERIGFHTSSIGEEAAIVGAALAARPADWIFPGAREWYAALARGMPLASYVHHAFGSAQDPAKGHASPDHAPARSWNVVPPSGVVGAHLPQAVGAAWAAKIAKTDTAALALFGAEVTSSGDFHNALNFAGVFKAPVVFVCRTRAGSGQRVADRAVAYGVASARVDGSDAMAVVTLVQAALARARDGKGATLVEIEVPALAALAKPESVLDDDRVLDLGPGDPLVRLREALVAEKLLDTAADAAIARETRDELDAAIAEAARVGSPAPATIFDHVYAVVPAHLAAQRGRMGDRVG